MEHSIREESGAVIASFRGEIDLEHSPKARELKNPVLNLTIVNDMHVTAHFNKQ